MGPGAMNDGPKGHAPHTPADPARGPGEQIKREKEEQGGRAAAPEIKPEPSIAPVQPDAGGGEEKAAPRPEPGGVYAHTEKQGKADSVFLAVVAVVAVLSAVVLALNGYGESSAAISILSFASTAVGALAGISYQRGR